LVFGYGLADDEDYGGKAERESAARVMADIVT
jgi:hypothetical protein